MKISRILLSEFYHSKSNAHIDVMQPTELLDRGSVGALPLLIICPGGGYGMVSKREGEPVALEFLSRGYVVAVLNYSTVTTASNSGYPMQFCELTTAVNYLAAHCDEFGIDRERVFLMGFSAGGHLACNLGVEYGAHADNFKVKIRGICLAYPVISSDFGTAGNTFNNLLRNYKGAERAALEQRLSFNNADLKGFPPTFLWTTGTDDLVSPLNSISFAEALIKHGRSCEFHLFPIGPHGLSTASPLINESIPQLEQVAEWLDLCDRFFKSLR